LFLPRFELKCSLQNAVNLLYVTMSRAMDLLYVFMKETPDEEVLTKLRKSFDEIPVEDERPA